MIFGCCFARPCRSFEPASRPISNTLSVWLQFSSGRLPIENRRYGRLKVCVTGFIHALLIP